MTPIRVIPISVEIKIKLSPKMIITIDAITRMFFISAAILMGLMFSETTNLLIFTFITSEVNPSPKAIIEFTSNL